MAKKSKASQGIKATTSPRRTGAVAPLHAAGALFETGDYRAARKVLDKIKSGAPGYLAARLLSARTYFAEKSYSKFLNKCHRMTAEFPDSPQSYHLLGVAYTQHHKLDQAEEAFRKALSLNPDDLASAENLGVVMDLNGWHRESYARLRQVLRQNGQLSRAGFLALIRNALLLGDNRTAHDAVRYVRNTSPADPAFVHLDARVAFAHNDRKGGKSILDAGVTNNPGNADLLADSGIFALSSGNTDRAVASLRKALQTEPRHSGAHYVLADMSGGTTSGKGDDRDARLQQMYAGINTPEVPYLKQVELGFAAGKVLDSLERYDEAFKCYDDANKKVWARLPQQAGGIDLPFKSIKRVFDDRFFSKACASDPDAGAGMVYLVGMPRSGTTLLEQMLSRLQNVIAGGEPAELENITGQIPKLLGRPEPYPDVFLDISNKDIDQLSASFMAQFRSGVKDGFWRTNKDMGLYAHLGLISVLFPAAKIIHCRRNPLDTCVSAYFQFFKLYHLQYSFDLAALARHYRAYVHIMDYWENRLPMNILQFNYEDLTLDPAAALKQVVEFCGMTWSDDCLNFEHSDHLVTTASIWQVRQGMHQNSVNRWHRYEKHLTPLIEELGDIVTS